MDTSYTPNIVTKPSRPIDWLGKLAGYAGTASGTVWNTAKRTPKVAGRVTKVIVSEFKQGFNK